MTHLVASATSSSMLFTESYRTVVHNDPNFGPYTVPIVFSTLTVSLFNTIPSSGFSKSTPWDVTFGSVEVSGVLSNDLAYVNGKTSATFPFKDPNTGLQTGVISLIWNSTHLVVHVTCNSDLLDAIDSYTGATAAFSDSAPISITLGGFNKSSNIYFNGRNNNRYDPVSQLSLDAGSITGIADFVSPIVAISGPPPNFASLNSEFNVVGSAADNVAVASVLWRWASPTDSTSAPASHFGDWQTVDVQAGSPTRATWKTDVDMSFNGPGTNLFWVTSQDFEGHFSPIVRRTYFYAVPSTLTLQTSGNGVIRGGPGVRDQANLIIQRHYTVFAIPVGTTNVFLNWTDGSGAVVSVNPRYDFVMQDSLLLQANFGPNPFPEVHGTYNGLFTLTNGTVNERESGMLSLTLGTRGTYTGVITLESGIYPFSGQFVFSNRNSSAVDTSFQPKSHVVTGTLHLPGNGTSGILPTLTGQLSVYDPVLAHHVMTSLTAGYSPGNSGPVRPGLYNFQIPTANGTIQNGPLGNGCGNVLVRSNGTALTIISLADQSPQLSCNGFVTQDGLLPVCVSLYAKHGLFFGSFKFSDQPNSDFVGQNVHWIKRRNTKSLFYPDGFERIYDDTVPPISGSLYIPPKAGTNVLGWTTGTISFADFVINGADTFNFDPVARRFTFPDGNIDNFRMIVLPTTGIISGTFSSSPTKGFRAVIMPKSSTVAGYFLDETQSGFLQFTNP